MKRSAILTVSVLHVVFVSLDRLGSMYFTLFTFQDLSFKAFEEMVLVQPAEVQEFPLLHTPAGYLYLPPLISSSPPPSLCPSSHSLPPLPPSSKQDLCWYYAWKSEHPAMTGLIPLTHVKLVSVSDNEGVFLLHFMFWVC